MRLANAAHESHPWRIREIVPDFTLEDVWALPVHGEAEDFQHIYFTLDKSLIALNRDGTNLWRSEFPSPFESSPIVANGRLYVGGSDGTVYAVGDCPSS